MPENPSPAECMDFPSLVDQLSEKLSFGDREKLGIFIRGMVTVILEAVEIKTQKKFSVDETRFCLANFNRKLGTMVKLEMVEAREAIVPKGICTVSIRESEYRGLPDGVKMGTDPIQKLPMVQRRRINVVDFRPSSLNIWFNVTQVLKINKRTGADLLQLDVEVKP